MTAKTDKDLAAALGCDRMTVLRNKRKPWHPPIGDDGWDVETIRVAYQARGILSESAILAGTDGESKDFVARKLKAEARKEEARARILTTRANKDDGILLTLDEVRDTETELVGEAIARLMAIPQTVGPLCGLGAEERIRDAIADSLNELAKLPWLKDESRKKLTALRKSALTTSQASFARPLDLAPSTGSVPTLNLAPLNQSPDITG